MILAFTDFGWQGPYLGEMRAAALRASPDVAYVDLMADAPAFRPDLAAYLLAALMPRLATGDVLLGVVDPGVGTSRAALAIEADGAWLIGPDNGLFELALRRARRLSAFAIRWRPERLSASFHGRDLFAPVAARIAVGRRDGLARCEPLRFPHWPDDLDAVVYIDGYGNVVTGRRADRLDRATVLELAGHAVPPARTFGEVPPGDLFWYANSSGLVEIARNGGSAAGTLGLAIGAPLRLQP
jgi:hypothetical protein